MSVLDENRTLQRLRFFEDLVTLRPSSVLDVGCGRGELLHLCRELGVPARGLEPSAERVAALTAEGLDVVAGAAQRLPFADGAFEWACLRHVAHHLEDPAAAVAELARVARRGVLMAEPWRDLDLPAQATARALDRWSKRQDRRLGRVHGDDLEPARLIGWLPDRDGWDVTYNACVGSRLVPMEEVEQEVEPRLEGLATGHADRAELEAILERATQTGVACTGTATVIALRR